MAFSWISSKLETKKSKIAGKGTFAKQKVLQGELLAAFGGYVYDHEIWRTLPEKVKWEALQIHDELVLGPKKVSEVGQGDYLNHSCDPNAGIKGQIFLVAMRDIKINEEITFDYAMVVSGEEFTMECRCGVASCRKVIQHTDWKMPELQRKYHGYFSWYLQEKIHKRKGG